MSAPRNTMTTLKNLIEQLERLETRRTQYKEEANKYLATAFNKKTKGNVESAKANIKRSLMYQNELENLDGQIYNIHVMMMPFLEIEAKKKPLEINGLSLLEMLYEQMGRLEKTKADNEEVIAKLRANATRNKTRGNQNAALKKAAKFVPRQKMVKELDTMIEKLTVLSSTLTESEMKKVVGEVDKVSAILSRPLGKMSAENEAALERQMAALTANAAATRSSEQAAVLTNMQRALRNAVAARNAGLAAAGAGAGAANVMGSPLAAAPTAANEPPPAGTPAYYGWLFNRGLLRNRPAANAPAPAAEYPSGPGIPVKSPYPIRIGGKSRRHTKQKVSRRTKTRRVH